MPKKPTQLPTSKEIKKPLLALLKRKGEVSLKEAISHIAKKFKISESAQAKKQGCQKETVLQNRIRWARWELKREGLIETTRTGYFQLVAGE